MRFSARERSNLYTEIAKLLEAGFPLENALTTLDHHPLSPASLHFVRSLRQHLKEGRTITEAVVAVEELEISGVEKNLIQAGERSGRITEVFEHLASYFERLHQTRKAVLRGLIYPAVVLHLGVFLFALPEVVAGGGLRAWGSALSTLAVFYSVAALAYFGYRFLNRQSRSEGATDQLLRRIPILGNLRRMLALERFAEVFRIYILSAFKPSEAIAAAGEASQSGQLREQSSRVSQQLVSGQQRLGNLLMANGAFPKDFAACMSTAEEAGTLDKELERWSHYYSSGARDAFARLETWLPKIIYVAISAYLVWKIVSWYLGYFGAVTKLL